MSIYKTIDCEVTKINYNKDKNILIIKSELPIFIAISSLKGRQLIFPDGHQTKLVLRPKQIDLVYSDKMGYNIYLEGVDRYHKIPKLRAFIQKFLDKTFLR